MLSQSNTKILTRISNILFVLLFSVVQAFAQFSIANQNETPEVTNQEITSFVKSLNYAPLLDPNFKDYYLKTNYYYEQFQKTDLSHINNSIFGLKNQYIRVKVNNQWIVYSLDSGEKNFDLPRVTSYSYVYDKNKQRLTIQGYQGANENGEYGNLVSEHYLKLGRIVALASDKSLLILIDEHGKISAIPKKLINELAFKAPIPVFQNLNGDGHIKFTPGAQIKSEFLTIAQNPIQKNEWAPDSIKPNNFNGQDIFEAGDLYVWELLENNNERSNVRRIPLKPILSMIEVGLMYLYAASQLVSFDQNQMNELKNILEELYTLNDNKNVNDVVERVDTLEKKILSFMTPETLKAILDSKANLQKYQKQQRDQFTYEEWYAEFLNLQENIRNKNNQSHQEEKRSRLKSLIQKMNIFSNKYSAIELPNYTVLKQDEISNKNYQQNLSQSEPLVSSNQTLKLKIEARINRFLSSPLITYSLIGAPILGFYTLSQNYEKLESLQQVKALSIMYELTPDVLKNDSYRSTLILSTMIQLSLIPLVFISAWSIKNSALALAKIFNNSTTQVGIKIKDFAQRHRELTTAQSLLAMNLKAYAILNTNYWKLIVEKGFGQNHFIPALKLGLNPLKKVNISVTDSNNLGPETHYNEYVGLHKPTFLNSPGAIVRTKFNKEHIQQILKNQKEKIERLAWILATKSVAEKYNIDQAFLWQAMQSEHLDSQTLLKILQDPLKQREWTLLTDLIIDDLSKLDELKKVLPSEATITPENMKFYYERAKLVAQKLSQMSHIKAMTIRLHKASKKRSLQFVNWAFNLGQEEVNYFKKITPQSISVENFKQSFIPDHIVQTLTTGMVGGMAQLNKPETLMAQEDNLLKTHEAQLLSAAFGYYKVGFAGAASTTLLFEKAFQDESEKNYLPRENFKIQSNEWSLSFTDAIKSWFDFAFLNPEKADIGGNNLRSYQNKLNTIFATITMTMIIRKVVGGQNLTDATLSFIISYLTVPVFIGWIMDFVRAGNRLNQQQSEENKKILDNLLYKISLAERSLNPEEGVKLYQEALTEALELYRTHHPKAIKELINKMNKFKGLFLELSHIRKINKYNLDPKLLHYYAQLQISLKTNNNAQYEKVKAEFIKSFINSNDGNISARDIAELNPSAFLEFVKLTPPLHTKTNHSAAMAISIFLGSIPMAYMGSLVGPVLVDPNFIRTEGLITASIQIAVAHAFVYYYILGKKPWETYKKWNDHIKLAAIRFHLGLPIIQKNAVHQYLKNSVTQKTKAITQFLKNPARASSVKSCKTLFN